MAVPRTRPTLAQRWPRGAEAQRRGIREAADDIRAMVSEAQIAADDNNRHLVRTYLAMIAARAADIQRLSVEARIGTEPTEESR